MDVDVTTWWLEQRAPEELRPARPAAGLAVTRAELASPQLGRFLYTAAGKGRNSPCSVASYGRTPAAQPAAMAITPTCSRR